MNGAKLTDLDRVTGWIRRELDLTCRMVDWSFSLAREVGR